ncbi:right-handed parallel beta-helix repeat-containing protein [Candidatus Micrarchaeota archaeon]|nr:right-handed parallel beta-helix repeat-containing protein [Candidatus Micrarchaeota archaeon]
MKLRMLSLFVLFAMLGMVSAIVCDLMIDTPGTTTLTEDITAATPSAVCIMVDNVVLDCDSHNINGAGSGTGIFAPDVNTITIRNCNVDNFGTGLYLSNSKDHTIINNNFTNNVEPASGVHLNNVNDSILRGNRINNNDNGIHLNSCQYITIRDNNVDSNYYGIYSSGGGNHTIEGNTLNSCNVRGIYLDSCSENTISGNTAKYIRSRGSGYGIYSTNGVSNTYSSNTFNENDFGMYLNLEQEATISSNTMSYNGYTGLYMVLVQNINIESNTLNNNNDEGIAPAACGVDILGSSNVNLSENTVCYNAPYGIHSAASSDIKASNNTFCLNLELPEDGYQLNETIAAYNFSFEASNVVPYGEGGEFAALGGNCQLYLDMVPVAAISYDDLNKTSPNFINYYHNVPVGFGFHNWMVACGDNFDNSATSGMRSLTSTAPDSSISIPISTNAWVPEDINTGPTGLPFNLTVLTATEQIGTLNINFYTSNPSGASFGIPELGMYFTFTMNLSSLEWAYLKIYYNDSMIPAGVDETTLRPYYFNPSTGSWETITPSGVNITGKYIWANITHFSTFGAGGSYFASSSSSSDSSKKEMTLTYEMKCPDNVLEVVVKEGGSPLDEAEIRLLQGPSFSKVGEEITGSDGTVSFQINSAGEYKLLGSAWNFYSYSSDIFELNLCEEETVPEEETVLEEEVVAEEAPAEEPVVEETPEVPAEEETIPEEVVPPVVPEEEEIGEAETGAEEQAPSGEETVGLEEEKKEAEQPADYSWLYLVVGLVIVLAVVYYLMKGKPPKTRKGFRRR